MKRCLVMQHVAFEDLGTFAPVLEEKGFAIRYCPVDEPPTEEEWLAADLAVVLGGAIGVYDQVLYPFLKDEKDLIRKRLESQKPLLGICLGAHLLPPCSSPAYTPARARKSAGAAWNSPKRAESRLCVFSMVTVRFCIGTEIRLICPKVLNCWPPPP